MPESKRKFVHDVSSTLNVPYDDSHPERPSASSRLPHGHADGRPRTSSQRAADPPHRHAHTPEPTLTIFRHGLHTWKARRLARTDPCFSRRCPYELRRTEGQQGVEFSPHSSACGDTPTCGSE